MFIPGYDVSRKSMKTKTKAKATKKKQPKTKTKHDLKLGSFTP